MAKGSSKKAELDDKWAAADELIRSTLFFSGSFTTAIRALKANEAQNLAQGIDSRRLNDMSHFFVSRLIKAPSLLAPFYYLSLTFHEEKIKNQNYVSRENLLALYKPGEIASILALIYLYHSLRRGCDKDEWGRYAKLINDVMEIGGVIGKHLPELGFANGLLVTGIRYLAAAVFLRADPKNFKNYKRDAKIKQKTLSPELEQGLWRCTHAEVGARLLQLLGFGMPFSQAFFRASTTPPKKELEPAVNSLRLIQVWSEALYLGVKPPVIKGEELLMTADFIIDQIFDSAQRVRNSGSKHSWLGKRKKSILPQDVPQLYSEAERIEESSVKDKSETTITELDEFIVPYADVPGELRDRLPGEEIEGEGSSSATDAKPQTSNQK